MRQSGPNINRRPRSRHHGDSPRAPSSNPMPGINNRPRSAASLRHQTFDSNGPDVRVRGNAWQVCEKYQSLARDALSSGDKVLAESYLQHAEHYFRIVEAIDEATAAEQRVRGPFEQPQQQPSVPPNYYGPDGTPLPQQPKGEGEQPVMAQAEVQPRNPPPVPPPFFATDEVEATTESLAANS